ncbi:serine hydrolase domain-containing protein [Salipaludibacillus aurantiacus]|uniref:CubicO group peptidase, beta-lactamase class C family n=1 Tax=Salipaludibacillus aurantiacus TaxID=1601833 RepID=A0A1H9WXY1_9BACI|nr:serine hydrolase domain-containing protein [Salipaludibacillus aurantiacus]SES38766.1 CubicO group peptidase, beta-lactamase class C family [Salipaludibacillus aurantiacus]
MNRFRKGFILMLSLTFAASLILPQQSSSAEKPAEVSIEEELLKESTPGFLPSQANPSEWAKAWERAGMKRSVLKEGKPQSVQMVPEYINDIDDVVQTGIEADMYPGAVVLAVKDGTIVKHEAYGDAVKYEDTEKLLPEEDRIATETDTIYDMASITKIFTSIAGLQTVEKDLVDLDEPVVTYLPEFNGDGTGDITVRHLMTHTSGLPAWIPIYTYDTLEERLQAVYEAEPTVEPGTAYVYSDLNMILLGKIVERVSGSTLDDFIDTHITGPLGMDDTMFNPGEGLKHRIAATEPQPYLDRGMVWGSVHDENAYSLNGVAGHAGIFSTAKDLAVLSQAILNGGFYDQARILNEETITEMLSNQITTESHLAQGLGWNLSRDWFMGELSSPVAAGHTGFTGTSFVIDPNTETIVIFLTNRVHPTRDAGSINPWRVNVVNKVVEAMEKHPSRIRNNN